MAEGGFDHSERSKPKKKQQLCRYFIHGVCRHGDTCRFAHDRLRTTPANNVCKFYQLGHCSYGKCCRYDHVRLNKSDQETPKINKHSETNSQDREQQFSEKSRQTKNGLRTDEIWEPSLVTLKQGKVEKKQTDKKHTSNNSSHRKNWARAKDFVPGEKFHAGATYARATESSLDGQDSEIKASSADLRDEDLFCPFFSHGSCPYQEDCTYIHGDICETCMFPILHPTDQVQRDAHQKACLQEMEKEMEHSFDVQESQKKECCICLEVVLEKEDKEKDGASNWKSKKSTQQFGILENCTHCFCLDCIRRWRNGKEFGKNVKVCPICRVHSDFVTPSNLWVEEEEKKKQVIQDYKDALRTKPCHYFKQGKGECPFNEKCFYKHAYPDGTIAKPKPRRPPRRQVNCDGESSLWDNITLWDFLERRDDGLISLEDELSLYLLGLMPDDEYFFTSDSSSSSDSDFHFL